MPPCARECSISDPTQTTNTADVTPWPSSLAACIERDVERLEAEHPEWFAGRLPNKTPSNGRWPHELTRSEAAVFGIDPGTWARSVAALDSYWHFSNFAPGMTKYPDAVYDLARAEHPALYATDCESVEAFAGFAQTFAGLKVRDAYAAWSKSWAWDLRQGVRRLICSGLASSTATDP